MSKLTTLAAAFDHDVYIYQDGSGWKLSDHDKNMVQQAIHKQIQTDPKVTDSMCLSCPDCETVLILPDEEVSDYEVKCCPECGKRISWEGYYGHEKKNWLTVSTGNC